MGRTLVQRQLNKSSGLIQVRYSTWIALKNAKDDEKTEEKKNDEKENFCLTFKLIVLFCSKASLTGHTISCKLMRRGGGSIARVDI